MAPRLLSVFFRRGPYRLRDLFAAPHENHGNAFIGIRYQLRSELVPQCHDERAGLGQPARLVFRVKGRRRRRPPSRWYHASSRAGSLLYGSRRGRWLGSSTRPSCFAGTRERGVHEAPSPNLKSRADAPTPATPRARSQILPAALTPASAALGRTPARTRASLHPLPPACRPTPAVPRGLRTSS